MAATPSTPLPRDPALLVGPSGCEAVADTGCVALKDGVGASFRLDDERLGPKHSRLAVRVRYAPATSGGKLANPDRRGVCDGGMAPRAGEGRRPTAAGEEEEGEEEEVVSGPDLLAVVASAEAVPDGAGAVLSIEVLVLMISASPSTVWAR